MCSRVAFFTEVSPKSVASESLGLYLNFNGKPRMFEMPQIGLQRKGTDTKWNQLQRETRWDTNNKSLGA